MTEADGVSAQRFMKTVRRGGWTDRLPIQLFRSGYVWVETGKIDRSGWCISPEVYEDRPAWRLDGQIADSAFSQWICMGRDGKMLEFHTRIDWKERHRMLKVDFPSEVYSGEVIGETAFGVQKRPTRRGLQWEKDRYEVCSQRYSAMENGREGIAVINDCKYGWSSQENCISLTLMRAPVMPDQNADQGIQEFSYACRPYKGSFGNAGIAQAAVLFNRESHLDSALRTRERNMQESFGLFYLEAADGVGCHVAVEAVKLSEDRKGDIILRLYETAGVPQRVKLFLDVPFQKAGEVDILERIQRVCEPDIGKKNCLTLDFNAFEIKSVKISTE